MTAPFGATSRWVGPAPASRANTPLRRRALCALQLRSGFARGRIFALALRFGLDGSLRSLPSSPKPYWETKKFFRTPACCRALRSRFHIIVVVRGSSTDTSSRMHFERSSFGACVELGDVRLIAELLEGSAAVTWHNAPTHFFFLLSAAFPLGMGGCGRICAAAELQSDVRWHSIPHAER
jgi:hypothetical protein